MAASPPLSGIQRCIHAPACRPIPAGSRQPMAANQTMAHRGNASQKMLILHAAPTLRRQAAWPPIKRWLEEPVAEYDLESGEVVGQRPRWHAIAPYLGISAATAAIFGLEAFAPTIATWLGLAGGAAGVGAVAEIAGPRFFGSFAVPQGLKFGTKTFGDYAHGAIETLLRQRHPPKVNFIFRARPGQTWVDVEVADEQSINAAGFRYAEIKPLTNSGRARFNRQVLDWDLSVPVQPIT